MTTQNVINFLYNFVGTSCSTHEVRYTITDEFIQSILGAIGALKKQVPSKLVFVKHTNRVPQEQDVPHCPNCDRSCEPFIGHGYTHCPYCGQAIDWEDK